MIVLAAYLKTTGLGCTACVHSSHCLVFRIILFFLSLALSTFDCYSDWSVWATIRRGNSDSALQHTPVQWTQSWLVFTVIGTATAGLYIINEASGVVALYQQYKKQKNIKKIDLCRPCILVGCNYITRAEVLALVNITLEDLPLLILTLLFSAAQYKCNHLMSLENLPIIKLVFLSSLASLLNVGWGLLRLLFHLVLRGCSHYKSKNNGTKSSEIKQSHSYAKELEAMSSSKESETSKNWRSGKEEKSKSNCSSSSWSIAKDCEKKSKPDSTSKDLKVGTLANQLYPLHNKMKWCLCFHCVTALLVYSTTICISVTAIVLTQHQQGLVSSFLEDPSQHLSVYRSYPQEEILVNVSSIAERDSGVCLTEEFQVLTDDNNLTVLCNITFTHSLKEGHIYYNYVGSIQNASNNTLQLFNVTRHENRCDIYYDSMFLGHYTATSGVRRFDETCLSLFISHDNNAILQRQRNLFVKC